MPKLKPFDFVDELDYPTPAERRRANRRGAERRRSQHTVASDVRVGDRRRHRRRREDRDFQFIRPAWLDEGDS